MIDLRSGARLALLPLLLLHGLDPPVARAQATNCAGLPAASGPIPAGTYTLAGSCVVTGTLAISGTVVINGNGQVVTGSNLHRIFSVTATGSLSLDNVRLTRGFASAAEAGGAVASSGALSITGSVLSENRAGLTGGAISSTGSLTVVDSLFVGNEGTGGGAIGNAGTAQLTDVTFVGNRVGGSNGAGGAIQSSGILTVNGGTFLDQVATGPGGAIHATGPTTIAASLFDGNAATLDGGALSLVTAATSSVTDSAFLANTADGNGGAIAAVGGSLVVGGGDFIGNRADGGGAIEVNAANLSVTGSVFVGNLASLLSSGGGAIADRVASTTVIDVAGTRFEANQGALGGAIDARNVVSLVDSALIGNIGTLQGGAMLIRSPATITGSSFVGNTADIAGAIYMPAANGVLDIAASSFRDNRATASNGGAIYLNDGNAAIANATFTGNTTSAAGAAIFARDTTAPFGTVALSHVTVSGNGAFALSQSNSMVLSLRNSLVAGNIDNCNQTLTDGGGNLVQVAAGGNCNGIAPVSTAAPLLGALTDGYLPLQAGSPAIDAAPNCADLATDQRGVARPQGSACDIGAYEAAPPVPEIFLDGFEPLSPR